MNLDHVIQELVVIESRLGGLLDDLGKRAVRSALAGLHRAKDEARASRRRHEPMPWRLVIRPELPLSFRPATSLKHPLRVDMFCDLSEPRHGFPTQNHNMVVRVWAIEKALWFRSDLDAKSVKDRVSGGLGRRVMLRFHFDCETPDDRHPRFHLQIGGVQHGDELCWYPSSLGEPRFLHHPMGLVAACEFVLASFYPKEYQEIAQEPTWKGVLRQAQEAYVKPYLDHLRSFEEEHSFLWHVWQWTRQ